MSIKTHSSPSEILPEAPLTYFRKEYFNSQIYSNFQAFSNHDFFIAFDLIDDLAISIPRSPFGSFFCRNDSGTIPKFLEEVCDRLKEKGAKEVLINHPSDIYGGFLSSATLEQAGFTKNFSDINQHIILGTDWQDSIHDMQKRKLASLKEEGFEFKPMQHDELETAHQFLTVCRQAQGLQINISWEQLKTLVDQMPEAYSCFGVFRDEKISALCIAVNVDKEVAYYYLPATSPMFRNKSPMVMLIAGMVDHYHSRGFRYLDLGVSSIEGKPQETLRLFKERMGGVETKKPTFSRILM